DAGDAEGVDHSLDNRWRAAWAIAEKEIGFLPRIGSFPNRLSGVGIVGRKGFLVFARGAEKEVDLAVGDDRAAVSFDLRCWYANLLLPQDLQRRLPRLDDFGRAAVALGAKPLCPIGGDCGSCLHEQYAKGKGISHRDTSVRKKGDTAKRAVPRVYVARRPTR